VIIDLDRSGTLEGFRSVLTRVAADPSVQSLLVLAGDANDHTPANTDAMLRAVGKPVYGGVFPGLISGGEHIARGSIVIGTRRPLRATVVRGLSDATVPLAPQIADAVSVDSANALLFVFVDGFARRIGELVRGLFEEFGVENNFIGGGAGSLSMQQKPCLFTSEGLLQDAALVLQLEWPSGVGVAHGWEIISEPLKVTGAEHTTIKTINYESAIDVYRRIVEPVAGRRIEADQFFDVAKGFPFGIRKLDSEVVVRDPLFLTAAGELVCVGEVPEGAFVHILRGDATRLVAAARTASQRAQQAFPAGRTPRVRFVIDCISRSLFLGDGFGEELAALDDGLPMVGALTLGEIANSGREFLEFYNKTAVVGLIATS
jgi:hypothetical protein